MGSSGGVKKVRLVNYRSSDHPECLTLKAHLQKMLDMLGGASVVVGLVRGQVYTAKQGMKIGEVISRNSAEFGIRRGREMRRRGNRK